MELISALFMGAVSGLTVFFPVSSIGTLVLAGKLFRFDISGNLFTALLLGLTAAGITACYKDFLRLIYSLFGIITDLLMNIRTFLVDRNRKEAYGYRRILTGNYRNFLVMLLLALVPSVLVGMLIRGISGFVFGNLLGVAMGFLITALVLFVSSYMQVPEKGPRSMKLTDALIIGVFQAFAFIPGISKIAASGSAGFLCGLSRRLQVKFSCLLCIISMIAMMLPGRIRPDILSETSSSVPVCLIGGFSAFAVGFFVVRIAVKTVNKRKNRLFAGYNLLLGAAAVFIYLLIR